MDYFMKNPFVFAAFVFPTVVTGLLVLVKPSLRAKVFGSTDDKKAGINVNSETPIPAYESGAENEIGVNWDASSAASRVEISDGGASAEAGQPERNNRDSAASANDLIYAIGIRPHPSS